MTLLALIAMLLTEQLPPGTVIQLDGGHQAVVHSLVYRETPVYASRPDQVLVGMLVTMYDPWANGVGTAEERQADGTCPQEDSGSMWRTGVLRRDEAGRWWLHAERTESESQHETMEPGSQEEGGDGGVLTLLALTRTKG